MRHTGYQRAPRRDGQFPNACPPFTGKIIPGQNKLQRVKLPYGPKDEAVSPHLPDEKDYFRGEWRFDDGEHDLVIREWCINRPTTVNARGETVFHDYIAWQIFTSHGGRETLRVPLTDAL